MEPTSYPSELKMKSSSDTIATEAHLPTIACPKGTIPLLQNSKADLKTRFSFDPIGNTHHRGGEVCSNLLLKLFKRILSRVE